MGGLDDEAADGWAESQSGHGSSSHYLAKRVPAPPSRVELDWEKDRRFGIVIDAGSSGSRLQVYSWLDHRVAKQQRLAAGNGVAVLPKIEKGVREGDDWTLKVEPGISSLAGRPNDVDDYLAPLFDHAKRIIPPAQLSSTPVYILATAGMRLLSPSDSAAILSRACAFVQHSTPFSISDCASQVRIISGEEEGVYGWIAINYLMDGFDSHGLADRGKGRHSSTYGFLDMGGASTQIAFEPSTDARKEHADNLLSVNLRLLDGMDVHHPVFVTTWLGYGTNQARERYVDATIANYVKENGPERPPDAASSPSSDEKAMTIVIDACLPKNLLLTERRHKGYVLRGSGDFKACLQKSAPLLNTDQDCSDYPCLMGVHVPPIDFKVNHFIGISEYWYSTQDIWSLGGVYDFPTFEKSALEYCAQDWSFIIKDHSEGGSRWKPGQNPPDLHRLEMQCFKAAWIVNILHEGIGIPRLSLDAGGEGGRSNGTEDAIQKAGEKGFTQERPPSFQSINEINDVAVSWTLGRMVLEVTDNIPKSASSASHDHDEDAGTPVFEWKTGTPSNGWRQRIGGYYHAGTGRIDPLVVLAFVLLAAGVYYFGCAKRRKGSWFGGFASSRGKPSRDDYGLVEMEEGGDMPNGLRMSNNASPMPGPYGGGPGGSRKVGSAISRALMPFRVLASRIAPSLSQAPIPQHHPLHKPSSSKSFLPLTRSSSSLRLNPFASTSASATAGPSSKRPTSTLKHSASSPTLARGKPFPSSSSSSHKDTYPKTAASSPTRAQFHIDLPAVSSDFSSHEAPLTPPVRPSSPGWALRMTSANSTPSSTRHHALKNGIRTSSSQRSLHKASNGSTASESEAYLSVPFGMSSTAPNVGGTPSVSSDDEKSGPTSYSRHSSYTNLSGLARNRGGHLRQGSMDVH